MDALCSENVVIRQIMSETILLSIIKSNNLYPVSRLIMEALDISSIVSSKEVTSSSSPSSAITSKLFGIVTLLKAQRLFNRDVFSDMDVLPVINICLNHIETDLRVEAFSFLCTSRAMVLEIKTEEIDLIKEFLLYNMTSPSPDFRNRILQSLSHYLVRLHHTALSLNRDLHVGKPVTSKGTPIDVNQYEFSLVEISEFFRWITEFAVKSKYPEILLQKL